MKNQDMRFPEALYYALKIRRKHPEFALCGSVALILAGRIPPRNVTDIDFVVCKSKISETTLLGLKIDESYNVIEKDGYKCYTINESGVFKYNLFVFENEESVKIKLNSIKLLMQDTTQILEWKQKFNRPKDKKDIRESKVQGVQF